VGNYLDLRRVRPERADRLHHHLQRMGTKAVSDDPIREEHRAAMNALAKVIDEAINGESGLPGPNKYGFALLVFDFGSGGFMNYISNADRATMQTAMQEFIRRQASRN
jgi:hypothetical protein